MPRSKGRPKQRSSRYQLEPQRKKKVKASPRWYGPLMLVLMGIGVVAIVWNYTRGDQASNTVLEGTGRRAGEHSEVGDPEPPDEVGERDGGEEGEPPGHRSTVAADRDRLAGRSRSRRFVSAYRRKPFHG